MDIAEVVATCQKWRVATGEEGKWGAPSCMTVRDSW